MKLAPAILAILLVAAVIVGLNSFFTVDEREQAIVVELGNPVRTEREAGLKFKLPFVQQVVRMDRRLISLDIRPQELLTGGQRRILVDSFARFRIIDPLEAYKAGRTEAGISNLLEQIMQSTVREVLADEEINNIVSGERAELMRRISERTNERSRSIGIEVADVRLKRVDLPTQNSQAIFARMETERKQEAAGERAQGQQEGVSLRADAERQVAEILAIAERDAQIVRGAADAQAVKIFADAFGRDKEFFEFYRTMQAYRKSLGKDDTTLVLSPDSEFFKLFIQDGGSR